ncbi:LysR substrate-binding domain-containing protein [Streptomyces mirabilis]|uniref:LysR substrate-binding domain-containing protein n=1 Tax=Streptomyces mirabilis TaxID=68239 RepID=UPI0036C1020F
MVERARRALNELERARAEIRPTPGAVTGIVIVGLLESATDLLAEPLASALARDRPGIELRLMTAYSGHLQRWLNDGDLDLSLLYNLASTPSLNAHPLVREHLWAVAPPDAGLRPDRPVPFARVAAHPLVMPTAGHALRSLIDAAAARAEVKLDVAVQNNSMRVQKRLILAGHGWTILPGVGIAGGTLSAAPLSEPDVWRSIVLGTPRTGRTPTPVEAVARELTRQIRGQLARRAAAPAGRGDREGSETREASEPGGPSGPTGPSGLSYRRGIEASEPSMSNFVHLIPPWILRPSGRRGNALLRSRAGKDDSPPGRIVVREQLPADGDKSMR